MPNTPNLSRFLVNMETARALRAASSEAIASQVESGQLRLVWNLSAQCDPKIAFYRFWPDELMSPERVAGLDRGAVIAQLLGEHRREFRGAELTAKFMVSRPHIHRLCRRGLLPARIQRGNLWVQRAALESFLTARFLGDAA